MESLVVTPELPWPLESGVRIREYHTIRELARRYDTTLVSLRRPEDPPANEIPIPDLNTITVPHDRGRRDALRNFALSLDPYRVAKFHSHQLEQALDQLTRERSFDLCLVHFLSTMCAVPETDAYVVLDQHNAEREYWRSFKKGGFFRRLFAAENNRRLRQLQNDQAAAIDLVWSVDESDAEAAAEWADGPVKVVPNGVDPSTFQTETPASDSEPVVLFVGSLDVDMNVDAVKWFVNTAWPAVRRAVPDATFRVVGRDPAASVDALDSTPGVEVVGRVESVVPEYERAAVFVAPFVFGGGTKLKILETLATRRPLVSTATGVKGIDVTHNNEVVIAERNNSFTDAVVEFLQDPERRDSFGQRGRELVAEQYSWRRILRDAVGELERCVS